MTMPQISADQAFKQLKAAVEERKTESSALATLQRGLAQLGYTKLPKTEASKSSVGTVRIYHYKDSPVGHLVLVAGPSIQTELHHADDLARAAAPSGSYIHVTGDSIPASLADRLSGAVKQGKAEVRAAVAAGEIKAPVEVKKPVDYKAVHGWTPKTTGAQRFDTGHDVRHGTGATPFRAWEPAMPAPAPAPAPSGMKYLEPGESAGGYGKPPRKARAPKAAPAAGPGGISAADMAMLQQLIASSVKASLGKW